MNRKKIKQILNTANMTQIRQSDKLRHFQYFNPYTSELVCFDCQIVLNKSHYDLHIANVQQLKNSCRMVPHHQNYIRHFRSFILATLIGGFDKKLVLCKNQFAAYVYKNFGGNVVCIKNPKGGKQWGVIK